MFDLSFVLLKQDLVDRFIMIDSEEKFHSLFNFEQSHHFGLRYANIKLIDVFIFRVHNNSGSYQSARSGNEILG